MSAELGVQSFHPDDRFEAFCVSARDDGSFDRWRQDVIGFAVVAREYGMDADDSIDGVLHGDIDAMVLGEHGSLKPLAAIMYMECTAYEVVRRGNSPQRDLDAEARDLRSVRDQRHAEARKDLS